MARVMRKGQPLTNASGTPVESVLRGELARADHALGGVSPVLRHVLSTSGDTLLSDAVVARVRGIVADLGRQLIQHVSGQEDALEALIERLISDTGLLGFVHNAAVESMLAELLEQQSAVDPVLSTLWQELIASPDAQTGETAMRALASQSRFMQAQRRMQLPLAELPADALERALTAFVASLSVEAEAEAARAVRAIKTDYDEALSRIGLLARLISTMQSGAIAALELEHAGLALFASGLSRITGQPRERCVVSCHPQQSVRLALGLRAAGFDPISIKRQLIALKPGARLESDLSGLSVEGAKAMLNDSSSRADGTRAL